MKTIETLLSDVLSYERGQYLWRLLEIDPALLAVNASMLRRGQIAQLLNMLLFDHLLRHVPEADAYAMEQLALGRKIVFDHGALRTVACEMHRLPSGQAAFSRLFEPLGYEMVGEYPLDKLKMCGFVYRHRDYPTTIAQYFVSELYPSRFSPDFEAQVIQLVEDSVDPLSSSSMALLEQLDEDEQLPVAPAMQLLRELPRCFDRQHAMPTVSCYRRLKEESAEMAWIATEGNVFNHATDRVQDLDCVVQQERDKGRAMKPGIEEGVNAHIRQTAYRASAVSRRFKLAAGATDDAVIEQEVPGSFFEFIERGLIEDPNTGEWVIDLRFDSQNAQGIFTMTRSQ